MERYIREMLTSVGSLSSHSNFRWGQHGAIVNQGDLDLVFRSDEGVSIPLYTWQGKINNGSRYPTIGHRHDLLEKQQRTG